MKKNRIAILLGLVIILESIYLFSFRINTNDYISELEEFIESYAIKEQISTNGKVYMIGNSITHGANWNDLLKDNRIVNKGISGITTMDAVMMVDELVPDRPDEVYIMLGVNDIKVNAPWDVAYMNYNNFLYSVKHFTPKTKINIISVLPVNYSDFNNYEIDNKEIDNLNQALEDLCGKYKFNYINCHDDFLNENGELNRNLSVDGLHLSDLGYDKLAGWIKPFLN